MIRHTCIALFAMTASAAAFAQTPTPLKMTQTLTGTAVAKMTAASYSMQGGIVTATGSSTFAGNFVGFNTAQGVLTDVMYGLNGSNVTFTTSGKGTVWTQEILQIGSSTIHDSYNLVTSGGVTSFEPIRVYMGNLQAYVGNGPVAKQAANYKLTVIRSSTTGPTQASLAVGSVQQTLTYSYLQHANASFAAGVDVNAASLVATPGGTAFDIHALGGANTALLDAVSFACTAGDCSAFALNLPSFQDLAAGRSVSGNVQLTTQVAGQYASTWTLNFIDNTARGVGQASNALTLQVQGQVSAVPEPAGGALLASGLLVLGWLTRRRRD